MKAPSKKPASVLTILDEKIHGSAAVQDRPERRTFEEFLRKDARVPLPGGEHGSYSFEGREAILLIVRMVDQILNDGLSDASLAIAGGAQWGKTIMELNLAAYCTGQKFLNFGLFLPDQELVAGVIDTKFRPDVVDQIPWFADMVKVGKAVNKSGKAVDRKGAFLVTDGRRRSNGIAAGLQKVPTTYTLDVAAMDEVDDIPEKNAKFVKGRLTSSQLRFMLRIGTQRVHGRGQHKAWKDGSQGVIVLKAPGSKRGINPEEEFPGIIRCAVSGSPRRDDPQLTWAGDFRRPSNPDTVVASHNFLNHYYLADPKTGVLLDRSNPALEHRVPERVEQRNVSVRVSQLGIGAIGLSQIVGQFQLAVNDPDEMVVFRCDVLALPQSTAQSLTPNIIERSQKVDPFEMSLKPAPGAFRYGGMDVGDRCYFLSREKESPARKRIVFATTFSSSDMVRRAQSLFAQLGLQCLFIDQRPEVSNARAIALAINQLNNLDRWPAAPSETDQNAHMALPGGLTWNGKKRQWQNLRCAVVRFDKKSVGAGIEHGFDIFSEGGFEKFVPLIRCNRFESIDRVVRELLTPEESVVEIINGQVRELPSMLLPIRAGSKIVEELENHFITGSEREKDKDGSMGDYVDKCVNHFLLSNAYSALAEGEGGASRVGPGGFEAVDDRTSFRHEMLSGRRVRL